MSTIHLGRNRTWNFLRSRMWIWYRESQIHNTAGPYPFKKTLRGLALAHYSCTGQLAACLWCHFSEEMLRDLPMALLSTPDILRINEIKHYTIGSEMAIWKGNVLRAIRTIFFLTFLYTDNVYMQIVHGMKHVHEICVSYSLSKLDVYLDLCTYLYVRYEYILTLT